jgi:hypothetical protein
VVDAYLSLYPSSLPESIVDTPEHHTQFIRKEMDRILAYATRDVALGRAEPEKMRQGSWLSEVEKWLTKFVKYREFYYDEGGAAQFDIDLVVAAEQHVRPGESSPDAARYLTWLEARLNEFKTWWTAHQNDPLLLPTPGAPPRPTRTLRLPPLLATVAAARATPTAVPTP